MGALSKAPGAETAVGEGDKRRAELGAGSCYGRAPSSPLPSSFFKGGGDSKEEEMDGGERAERWMRCLSDPLCPRPPLPTRDVFIPGVEREPSHCLMMTMVISLPTRRWRLGGGESRGAAAFQPGEVKEERDQWEIFHLMKGMFITSESHLLDILLILHL